MFRHFGAKEQLVGAVLDHLGAQLSALLETDTPADVLQRSLDRQIQVMARTVLDGYPAGQLQALPQYRDPARRGAPAL